MEVKATKLGWLNELTAKQARQEGLMETAVSGLYTYKISEPLAKQYTLCDAFILILSQGNQVCCVGDRVYDYSAGKYLTLFLPMALEVEALDVSPEEPILAVCIKVDLTRMAALLIKMNAVTSPIPKSEAIDATGIYAAPVSNALIDPVIRLLQTLDNPTDIAMLSESIVDEIYYRILDDNRAGTGSVHHLLEQRGQIQQIARAVHYIQEHLDEKVSVEQLATLVNMSTSSFHRNFKEVMHMSPLKYAQIMKLFRAQTLIKEGHTVSEAGYQVGYNSPAQFSREYKRHFGISPSAQQ